MSAVSIQPTFAFDSGLSLSEIDVLQFCQSMSAEVWSGYVDGKLICCWGLIPPTLLSNQAYLWMHSTPAVREHSFLLVRHSQRIIEQVLNRYEKIIGDCRIGADDSIRWLKWLGAEFTDSDGPYLSFVIRRK
jgi:hypothetical protein